MNDSFNWLFNDDSFILINESPLYENFLMNHWMSRYLKENDKLIYQVGLTDRDLLLQYDEILVDAHNVYWQAPRTGNIYLTDSGGVEAETVGGTNVFKRGEIDRWDMICTVNHCFLEAKMKNGDIHRSLELPESEINSLRNIQKRLNEFVV